MGFLAGEALKTHGGQRVDIATGVVSRVKCVGGQVETGGNKRESKETGAWVFQ